MILLPRLYGCSGSSSHVLSPNFLFQDSSTQVFVFSGSLADEDYELEHYTISNIQTNLPQQLPGSLKTFVVYGSATIQLAPTANLSGSFSFKNWKSAFQRPGAMLTSGGKAS